MYKYIVPKAISISTVNKSICPYKEKELLKFQLNTISNGLQLLGEFLSKKE